MTIAVIAQGDRLVAQSSFAEKDLVKAAGFRWDPARRQWWTADPAVAARLADPERLQQEQTAKAAAQAASIAASRATDADRALPVPDGLSYLPFQRAGIAFGLDRPAVLIADEMGLGKTIQAIGIVNADPSIRRILILCPASLRLNWARELAKWLVAPRTIGIADTKAGLPDTDIVICNYDITAKLASALRAGAWDLLVADECHYLKNATAQRTVAVLGRPKTKKQEAVAPIPARRQVFLTGTPIPNRPVEGWTIFNALGVFDHFFSYARRYCDAYQDQWGWHFDGASNLPELQEKLRGSVMVRRLKADVLTELPAKRRQVIELVPNGAAAAVRAEQAAYAAHEAAIEAARLAVELAKASDDPDDYRAAVARLNDEIQVAFQDMSRHRKEVALAKLPHVIEHLQDAMEDGAKVVAFAHHHEVIDGLLAAFPEAAKLDGRDPMQARQDAVDRFQAEPSCQLFIGGIQAAGVGLTLTAAAHVVFAELDWVPGNMSQAEDRCHRIGQQESVLVQHLVVDGSLDARMAHTLVRKQAVLDAALDTLAAPATPSRDEAATESATQRQIREAAEQLTAEEIAAIHQGLQMLARVCDGAASLDDMGFAKIDVAIGHSLAQRQTLTPKQAALGQRLVRKYRRQLPAELLAAAGLA
jgi:SNF2 family DNA or RNA helicase